MDQNNPPAMNVGGLRALDPPTLPDDRDVYLVLDDFGGRLGRAWRETDEDQTDRATCWPCSRAVVYPSAASA